MIQETSTPNRCWKQPIPVTIPQLNGDLFATTVFQKILLRCSNEGRTIYIDDVPIELLRGQCTVGRFELAKCFGLKQKESMRIQRILVKLEKSAKLITKRKSINCSIVTVLNYDYWTEMTKPINNPRHIDDQTMNTNKNDKSEKKHGWTPEALKAIESLGGINI